MSDLIRNEKHQVIQGRVMIAIVITTSVGFVDLGLDFRSSINRKSAQKKIGRFIRSCVR